MASEAASPYLLYIKLALIALAIAAVVGVCWYIKSVFAERQTLIADKTKLEFSLQMEQQKVVVAMEQLKIWQDTVAKMNAAVKNIKIQSDTYIQGIDDANKPTFDGTHSSIPFILPAMSTGTTVPGYANYSASRVRAAATPR
jgi:hypothetical protein